MGKKKVHKPKTWLLIKNPQFCSNQANILATKSAHEMIILTKFHKDRTKIVDFLLIAKFWACKLFFVHPLVIKSSYLSLKKHFAIQVNSEKAWLFQKDYYF